MCDEASQAAAVPLMTQLTVAVSECTSLSWLDTVHTMSHVNTPMKHTRSS